MRWLGQMQRAFELMCARANARYAHGSLLAEKGEIQRYVAESAADIQSLRLMTLDVTADTPLEKMYRDARYARLYDGPDEVHRMVVARRLLKDCTDGAPWVV